jgi:RNA recognition motif-containing protein
LLRSESTVRVPLQEEDLIGLFNSGHEQPALEGAVDAVRIIRDSHSRVGKGIAYILFKTKVAALAALQMDGTDCNGRAMRVMQVQKHAKASTGGGAARVKNKLMKAGDSKKQPSAGVC